MHIGGDESVRRIFLLRARASIEVIRNRLTAVNLGQLKYFLGEDETLVSASD